MDMLFNMQLNMQKRVDIQLDCSLNERFIKIVNTILLGESGYSEHFAGKIRSGELVTGGDQRLTMS